MNENEELLTATEQAGTDEQVMDIDDVEGHGLREVAAGLGAAAVLAGGAGAATAAVANLSVHPSLPGTGTQASVSINDPITASDQAVDGAIADVRADRAAAIDLAAHEVSATASNVGTASRLASQEVGAAARLAGNATTTATKVTAGVENAAFETTNKAGSTAGSTVTSTSSTASSTTSSTTSTATRKAATVLTVTTHAASVTTTDVLMTVSDLNPSAGTSVSTQSMTGWISIQIGGRTLAQVQVVDGKASISLNTKDIVGQTVNFVYSGDAEHASCARSLTLNV
jgi:hypothetical protein